MAAGGGTLNLSLLSRGVGEVSKNGHEKVDVVFEPQDYFNLGGDARHFYLPPIESQYAFGGSPRAAVVRSGPKERVNLPKTFTTRKGALLLFSEDLAQRTHLGEVKHKAFGSRNIDHELTELEPGEEEKDLKTVDDLAKSILSYGSRFSHDEGTGVNLKFIHSRRQDYFERQIRPGFSAKRYLSTWTKSWDDNVLEKVVSKGYLTEKSLFYYNPLMPHLSRRLNDDMSHYPPPYKLMRSMLMSPGSLSGYTFYRVRPESQETDYRSFEDDEDRHTRSIKVLTVDKEGAHEVSYGNLEPQVKNKVLTDLLVKSAVSYAMKTQEYVSGYVDPNRIPELSEVSGGESRPVPQFDMQNAVETFLQDQKGGVPHQVLEADIPERDDSSQLSGSFKGGKVGQVRPLAPVKDRGDRDVITGIPITFKEREGPSVAAPFPVLPPIGGQGGMYALTPIGEASREHTQAISLPPKEPQDGDVIDSLMPQVNVIPSTPQYSIMSNPTSRELTTAPSHQTSKDIPPVEEEEEERWVGQGMTERDVMNRAQREAEDRKKREEKRRTRLSHQNLDLEGGPVAAGGVYVMSSSESLGPGSVQSLSSGRHPVPVHRQQWKGSTQSLRSYGSGRKGPEESVHSDSSLPKSSHTHSLPRSPRSKRSSGSANEEGSFKGSIIYAPDGEIVKVGGTIQPTARPGDVVAEVDHANLPTGRDVSDDETDMEPDEWRVQPRRPISARKAESLKRQFQRREIDYTSGDIDATVSIHSWSYGARDGESGAPRADNASVHSLPILRYDEGMTAGLEEDKEVWEDIRHSSFVKMGSVSDVGSATSKTAPIKALSPQRSHTDLRMASRTSLASLQRSHSTPLDSDRSDVQAAHSRSRPTSETLKTQRPLQSQLSQIEVETEIIREQTEVSMVTETADKLSRVSEGEATTIVRLTPEPGIQEEPEEEEEEEEEEEAPDVKLTEELKEEITEPPKTPDDLQELPEEEQKGEEPAGERTPSEPPALSSKPPSEARGSVARSRAGSDSSKTQISEQEIIDMLTEHASKVAESVLSQDTSGADLEEDIRLAASMWMEQHPPRDISRSQSVSEPADRTMINEVMKAQKRNSAGPTAAEYRDQIRENLVTAIAKVAGVDRDSIPLDAEIDPELMQALANSTLTPDDIEIVRDEESGRSFIRSRRGHIAQSMGGVKEGHIYLPAAKDGAGRGISIPSDRVSNVDVGEMGVINYGVQTVPEDSGSDKASQKSSEQVPSEKPAVSERGSVKAASSVRTKSPAKSVVAGSGVGEDAATKSQVSVKSGVSFKAGEPAEAEDEFKKAVADLDKAGSPPKSEADAVSLKSGKSGVSDDKKSKVSSKKAPTTPDKREEFVVGKVENKKELEELYGQPVDVPARTASLLAVAKSSAPSERSAPTSDKTSEGKVLAKKRVVKEKPPSREKSSTKEKPKTAPAIETDIPATVEKVPLPKPPSPQQPVPPPGPPPKSAASQLDHTAENKKIYGMPPNIPKGKPKEKKPKAPPAPKKDAKKGKKGTKKGKKKEKEEEPAIQEPPPEESALLPKEPSPEPKPPKQATPKPPTPPESYRDTTPEVEESDDGEDFIIIRDETPSPEPIVETRIAVVTSPETEIDEEQSEADKMRMISNREARAAKRAAAAEKRKQEVEKKRREREDQAKKEREEFERQEKLKQELEEQRKRKAEERMLRKQQEDEENRAAINEQLEREKRRQQELEREKRMKEEYARKLEDMKRKQAEEDLKRKEEQKRLAEEEEERRKAEEELLATMAEQERIEYERRKKEEEEERLRKEEEEKRRREEEAQRALEEARRLAEEMARKQAEMEARLRFNRTLQLESHGMEHTQDITKAFVFSYYELLQWLGLDVPEFELLKLNQY